MRCVMVPNPYFGDLRVWEASQKLLMKQNVPWDAKYNKVFYRGRCARGSESRFKLMCLQNSRLDVAWLKKGLSAECLQLFTNNQSTLNQHLVKSGHQYAEEHFSKYKFLVRLPGSSGGSYSRHLNYLWNKGAIVLLWESPVQEWYYKYLEENVTHITVNENSIVDTVERCLRLHRTEQLKFVQAAHSVFQRYLSRHAIALEWYRILLEHSVKL
mmetsp:Transcript_8753/g.21164  ORF Transcript_8753/g.21164 Transcript_8753/m.21164 type:complete len:213 (+) Transcript_8753:100-738(+)